MIITVTDIHYHIDVPGPPVRVEVKMTIRHTGHGSDTFHSYWHYTHDQDRNWLSAITILEDRQVQIAVELAQAELKLRGITSHYVY